ncbi:MAG: tol-pal system protein YbgF [Pseudomonadota bacterium]|nr:tol-pal system protein YbgF [Pseudomonadota bacterium]
MRKLVLNIAVAAALVAAAPAWAQRASLADRVALLEQRAADNQGNIDLLRQVEQLTREVQLLRSQVEELNHQQEQIKQTARSQYLDLDSRLNRLEGGNGAALDVGASATPVAPAARPPSGALPEVPREQAPSIHGDAGSIAQAADEREVYDVAFNALKAGRYDEAAGLFESFLARFPGGSFAPNALYWLGESHYATQRFDQARQQFESLLQRYPTHDKAPGALLKVGLSFYGQRQLDDAERTLGEVVSRYPGTDAARTAADRLAAIQLNRLR